ncbi:hypothetical protein JKP88DRAFT_279872 [Tribonema minus]|uniref:Uncharacterized protein n=1 Tax=Tribonema minus TaxID=303371 RepID=A0A835YU86_9STRA|nr:hypothetical protein JKP88DRAFT_279872 [Tribonema minus]
MEPQCRPEPFLGFLGLQQFGAKLKLLADAPTASSVTWSSDSVNGESAPVLEIDLEGVCKHFKHMSPGSLKSYPGKWHFMWLNNDDETATITKWYLEGFDQHCDPSTFDHTGKIEQPAAALDNEGKNKKAAARKHAARLRSDAAAAKAAEAAARAARFAASAEGKRRRIDADRATAADDSGGSSGASPPPRRPSSPASADGGGGGGGGGGYGDIGSEGDDD